MLFKIQIFIIGLGYFSLVKLMMLNLDINGIFVSHIHGDHYDPNF